MSIRKPSKNQIIAVGAVGIFATALFFYYENLRVRTDNAYVKSNMILLSPKVSGTVTAIFFEDNAFVKKGAPLFKIDPSDYTIHVAKAKADIDAARAYHQSLVQQEALQQTLIKEAQAGVKAAEATLKEASNNLGRTKKLNAKGAESDRLLDAATSKQQNALSASMQAVAKHQGTSEALLMIRSKQAAAIAESQKAEASLKLAEHALEDTLITASFDGIVTKRGVYTGQMVNPGMNLAYLISNKGAWIEGNFKENQITHIEANQNVDIQIDAYPKIKYKGHVLSLTPAAGAEFSILPSENATGNFTKIIRRIPVKIAIDGPLDKLTLLKSGLSAELTVHIR